ELKPTHIDAHMHLGEVLLASGLPEQAVGHLEKASAARPGEAGILRNVARSYVQLGRFDEAENILQRLDEGDVNVPLLRGTAALKREQLDEAEKQLRQAIAMA